MADLTWMVQWTYWPARGVTFWASYRRLSRWRFLMVAVKSRRVDMLRCWLSAVTFVEAN